MRKLIIIIITAITIVACGGNSDKKAKTENVKLLLDSISESTKMKSGNQQIECEAEVFYPKDVESIKKDLTELVKQLGQGDDFDGYPDTVKIDTTDIGSLVKYLVQSKAVWLKNNFSDEEAEPGDIPLAYELKVYVLEETPKYITMEVKETSLYNGPRPRYTTYGITYLKPDGKKVESSDLNSDHIDDIKKDLLDKVKTHISGLIEGEDFKAEDVLYKQDENSTLAEIDLPYNGIYVTNDSMVFPYQIEELTAFTFGQPEVKMSLKDMKEKGWLGKTLSEIFE